MSEPIRIALVSEGPTDKIVIESAIFSILGNRTFILKQLQPEESLAFGEIGTGWAGVYRWCKQAGFRTESPLRNDILYLAYDILVIQIDADVAEKQYADGAIEGEPNDLPCVQPCPPVSATTNNLRMVLLRWVGEQEIPPKTVFCTPSKSMEAWVVTALFPEDDAVQRGIECFNRPENRLSQRPLQERIRKNRQDYSTNAPRFREAWPRLVANLEEANRFQVQLLAEVPPIQE